MNMGGRRSRGGFSLIEVMMGAMVLGIVLGSILAMASHAFGFLTDIRRRARSSQVLQQRMEDLRLLNWSQLQACPATFTDPSDPGAFYAGTITQEPADWYHGTATVMKVTLTVTWTNRLSRVQTNSLTTLIGHGGLNKYIF